MSALGNYIHYHKINYRIYGTNRIGQLGSSGGLFYYDPYTINIQQLMTEADYLEKQYNDLFYPSQDKINKKTKEFKNNLEKLIQKKLDKEFGLVAGTFNAETLSVDRNELYAELNRAIGTTKEKIGIAKVSKNATAQNLLKQIDLMYEILNQREFKNIQEIKGKIQSTKRKLTIIKNNLNAEIARAGSETIKISDQDNDVQSLKNIIQQFNRTPLLYKQNKAVFEWLAPFIKLQGLSLTKKELARTMRSLASDKITVKIDPEEEQGIKDISFSIGSDVTINTLSNDKGSNILIEYMDTQGEFKETVIASKNITSGTKIQLINKTSLYQILSLLNSYNFGNHYLNVITSAEGQTSKPHEILEANRILKQAILSLSIKEFDSNNNSEFLIINDSKKRKIYVYSLKALVYLIQKSIETSNKYSNVINLSNDYTIKQKFEDTVKTRLSKVLQATKNKKIDGFISPSMLNSYLSLLRSGKT